MCDEKSRVMELVKKNGRALRNAAEELRADKEVVLAAVRQNGRALQYASEELKDDREVVLEAVKQNWIALGYAAKELRNDDEIMLAAVKQDGTAVQYYKRSPKTDWCTQYFPHEIMKEVNSQDCFDALSAAKPYRYSPSNDYGNYLYFRDKFKPKEMPDRSLRSMKSWDREKTLEAVRVYGPALGWANETFRSDREVVLAAVKRDGMALKHADKALQADKEVVLAAVKSSGYSIGYADEGMRADREVVLAAVKCCGSLLKHASKELRADKEIVLAAVKQEGMALQYACRDLLTDREIVLAAIATDCAAWRLLTGELATDREVLMELAKKSSIYTRGLYNPFNPVFLCPETDNVRKTGYSDRDIVIELAKSGAMAWEDVCEELRKNKGFILTLLNEMEATVRNSDNENLIITISFMSEQMLEILVESFAADMEIQLAADSLKKAIKMKEQSSDDAAEVPEVPAEDSEKWKDRDFVLDAVKRDGNLLEYAEDFQDDDEVALAAVRQNGMALQFANTELSDGFLDKELVLEAVKQNGMALQYADERLRADKQVVLAAVKQNPDAVDLVHHCLRNDKEVWLTAVSNGKPVGVLIDINRQWTLVQDIDLLGAEVDYHKRYNESAELLSDK